VEVESPVAASREAIPWEPPDPPQPATKSTTTVAARAASRLRRIGSPSLFGLVANLVRSGEAAVSAA
jgi:hypothetical protein